MNELSVRSRTPGVTVAAKVTCVGNHEADQRLLILIHGFNNSCDEARTSYERFDRNIHDALRFRYRSTVGSLWGFHWPGNHENRTISALTYAVRVPDAQLSGERLADYLAEKTRSDQDIVIVAHSLGCRVALHALMHMRNRVRYQGGQVRAVFLLAAAVPVELCSGIEVPYAVKLQGAREYVFHSTKDKALRRWFSRGEYLYSGLRATAVGRSGLPIERWTDDRPMKLGHSDYWPSPQVVKWIVLWLGAVSAGPIPERSAHVVEDMRLWRERRRTRRQMPARSLPERNVG
jgi:pimeloyl-ACP methyl ester carboxylesterase